MNITNQKPKLIPRHFTGTPQGGVQSLNQTSQTYEPRKNAEGKYVLDKNNPQDMKWWNQQQANRGAKAVYEGRKEFAKTAMEITQPIVAGATAGFGLASPISTAMLLGSGWAGSKVGEQIAGEEGRVIGGVIGGGIGAGLTTKTLNFLDNINYGK